MGNLKDNWTRDHNGQYVDWSQPPYRQPTGVVLLQLEGEDPNQLSSNERIKRAAEYTALMRRRKKKNPEAVKRHLRALSPCRWPGCDKPSMERMWACTKHWKALPVGIRSQLLLHWQHDAERQSVEALRAEREATEYAMQEARSTYDQASQP